MVPHRSIGTVQHKLSLFFLAAVAGLLVGGSVVQAATDSAVAVVVALPNLSSGGYARILHLALPVPSPMRLQAPPVPRDERRVAHPGARMPSPGAKDSPRAVDEGSAAHRTDPGLAIQWRESREITNPDIVSLVRNFHRDGLPIVHLWQTNQNLLAIGFNAHGLPGIYFTRHVGG